MNAGSLKANSVTPQVGAGLTAAHPDMKKADPQIPDTPLFSGLSSRGDVDDVTERTRDKGTPSRSPRICLDFSTSKKLDIK